MAPDRLAVTILLVDHDRDGLASMARFLRREIGSATVVTAPDAVTAIRLMDQQRIDVLVTAYRLPVVRGDELLASGRQRWPGMRQLMITASHEPGLEFKSGAFVLVLRKPLVLPTFISTVRALVEGQHPPDPRLG